MSSIEVEFRASITDRQQSELIEFFTTNGSIVLDGTRTTTKYGPHDLRIREDWKGTMLMLKIGDINNQTRQEHEVKIDNPEAMKHIITALGLDYIHSWKTKRKKFTYNNMSICIDEIPGFMKTIEIEKITTQENENQAKQEIQSLFTKLNLKQVDPKWFTEQIEKYNKNFLQGKIKL